MTLQTASTAKTASDSVANTRNLAFDYDEVGITSLNNEITKQQALGNYSACIKFPKVIVGGVINIRQADDSLLAVDEVIAALKAAPRSYRATYNLINKTVKIQVAWN